MCEASGQVSNSFVHVTWMRQGGVDMSKVPFVFFFGTLQVWKENISLGCFSRSTVLQTWSALLLFFSSRVALSIFLTHSVKITIITYISRSDRKCALHSITVKGFKSLWYVECIKSNKLCAKFFFAFKNVKLMLRYSNIRLHFPRGVCFTECNEFTCNFWHFHCAE